MNINLIFKELTLKNFLSYGNNETKINLLFNEPILIEGRNYDAEVDGQVDSNGSGKSAILNAIAYALYDKPVSKIEKGKLINNINKKNMKVALSFEQAGTQYKVIRERKTKTKSEVTLYREDKKGYKDITPDSASNTNKEIERIIGMPFEIFARIVVFSATFQPFLSLPTSGQSGANQKDIIEELFGYTDLSVKGDYLKQKIKDGKSELNHLVDLNEHIKKENYRFQEQLENALEKERSWSKEQEEKIEDVKQRLKKAKNIDFESEEEKFEKIKDLEQQVSEIDPKIKELKTENREIESGLEWESTHEEEVKKLEEKVNSVSDIDVESEREKLSNMVEIKRQVDELELEWTQFIEAKNKKEAEIENLDKEIEHLKDEKCPYCLQKYEDASKRLKEADKEKGEKQKEIESINKSSQKASENARKKSEEYKNLKESLTVSSEEELSKLEKDLVRIKSKLESKKEETNPYIEDVKASKNRSKEIEKELKTLREKREKLSEEVESLEDKMKFSSEKELMNAKFKIESLETDLERLNNEGNPHSETVRELKEVELDKTKDDQIDELSNTIEHQEFLHKLLTKKDSFIRKALLNKSIPFLNTRLKYYLDKLGLPHRVEFTHEMTARITQFGSELDFDNLSSGQKARVNLALSFAFRDVLQARHGSVNFCILDECLDTGLGNVGVQMAAKMIKEVARENNLSMFVISHRDEISSMFDDRMVVELRNGFSKIREESENA